MRRRDFLLVSAGSASGALLGLLEAGSAAPAAASVAGPGTADDGRFVVSAWLALERDGGARVRVHKSEMGQGVLTALPMLIAEELDLPLERVHVELAPGALEFRDARGNQTTGYSSSVSSSYLPMRTMGAAAREMLCVAAARRWSLDAARLETLDGEVLDRSTLPARRIGYGELLADLHDIPVPAAPRLKQRADFRVIGRPARRLDTPAKIDGSACFGYDVRVPGMRVAMIARSPDPGGRLGGFDARGALAVTGVERVVQVPSGVAVVARDFWSASRGRDALEVRWEAGAVTAGDSGDHARALRALLDVPGTRGRHEGDPESAERERGAGWLQADYWTPFLAHAALEPLAATAHVQQDRCDLWLGTQAPSRAQDWAARLTGLPPERVFVHTLPIGGAFGRRGEWDFVVEAVEVSRATGWPVKVLWTRADDLRHDFYRPATANRLSARVAAGRLEVLTHRIAAPSVARRRSPEMLARGGDFLMTQGSSDLAYAIPHLRVDFHEHDLHVPVGFWRSVGHSHTGFALECFIDEAAHAARRDPWEFRDELLAHDPRMQAVLRAAAEAAGWRSPRPRGVGLGIACMESYGTRVAEVAEVEVHRGALRVRRVVCALDCGQVVNPAIVEQQMQGGIVFGLSAALYGEISFAGGAVRQSNYHDYAMLAMPQMPRIDVVIVPSDAPPGGCGEPSTPLIAPAVCNAVFAACGRRIRSLPIRL